PAASHARTQMEGGRGNRSRVARGRRAAESAAGEARERPIEGTYPVDGGARCQYGSRRRYRETCGKMAKRRNGRTAGRIPAVSSLRMTKARRTSLQPPRQAPTSVQS